MHNKEGAPGFMENLCPSRNAKCSPSSYGVNGLQAFQRVDVSIWPVYINRVFRSTLLGVFKGNVMQPMSGEYHEGFGCINRVLRTT